MAEVTKDFSYFSVTQCMKVSWNLGYRPMHYDIQPYSWEEGVWDVGQEGNKGDEIQVSKMKLAEKSGCFKKLHLERLNSELEESKRKGGI